MTDQYDVNSRYEDDDELTTQLNNAATYVNESIKEVGIDISFKADKTYVDELFKTITKKGEFFVNVKDFGAKGDGVTNDLQAVKDAIATLQDGDVLFFPRGTYILTGDVITISITNIEIIGNALLKMDYGFRPTESGFTVDGLRFEATVYSSQCRAIQVDIPPVGKVVRNFAVRNCKFKNFFYACRFAGGSYEVTGNEAIEGYPVRDVVVENCYSETYEDKNCGHFQCIQVENFSYIENSTYGGQNATSYNAIKANGYGRIIGNYDENNSYGSCEIENISSRVVITGNTFKRKLWIDDSSNVVATNNTVGEYIFLTVQHHDLENIIIADNITDRIRVEQYSVDQDLTKKGRNITIDGNTIIGTSGSYGVFISGLGNDRFENVDVTNNKIHGTFSSGKIGVVRSAGMVVTLEQNTVNGTIVITGSGGLVYGIRNTGASHNGTRDSKEAAFRDLAFDGLTLVSANGTKYKLYVGDSGTVYTIGI